MERSFLLPLPKFQGLDNDPKIDSWDQIQDQTKIDQWQDRLNQLTKNPALWKKFRKDLVGISKEDWICLCHFASNDDLQTVLHLAVLNDEMECISRLKSDNDLFWRRNQFGLTALELACYLHKTKSMAILDPEMQRKSFLDQPNIEFEDCQPMAASHVELLNQPIFESNDVLEEIFTFTDQAKAREEIPPDRIWMGVYYDQEIQHGIYPRMAVCWIDSEIGLGVFARERILPCTFVGEYTGVIQKRTKRIVAESDYCFRYTSWKMGRQSFVIDAKNMGNFTRFINHSDQPNTSLICTYWRGAPRLILVSLKEISEGSQLTLDYGKTFWKQQSSHLVKKEL